jgi:predicted 3-demethylubiquinone-9 3-methyltransferase (glyoxalase superfamily)
MSNTKTKNTICFWFNKDAQDAARFYAATFPNSEVTAIHKAPGDYPNGKAGDILTVEFTVFGIHCLGLNGGPMFKHRACRKASSIGRVCRSQSRLCSISNFFPVPSRLIWAKS